MHPDRFLKHVRVPLLVLTLLAMGAQQGCSGGCDSCGYGQECSAGACVNSPPPPDVVGASCQQAFAEDASCTAPLGTTYYVATTGSDSNDGKSEASPIQTLAHASALPLGPGDRLLFHCGDVWRGEQLHIKHSGAPCQHIVVGSYPAACPNQPRFAGSYPITGWTQGTGGVWVADVSAGANAGHFPNGINQLFRNDQRLPLGRWPNLNDPAFPGGYSHIETHDGGRVIGDSHLPAGNWSGAAMHHFYIRWVMLNSQVASSGAGSLTLAAPISCYDQCGDPNPADPAKFGWGYFLNNHRLTLDRPDEWYYDATTHQVSLVSATAPTGIEGSIVDNGVADAKNPTNDEGFSSQVLLGPNATTPIHHVVVENLRLDNSWRNAIGTPINTSDGEPSDLVIRCNTIRNPDSKGINLSTWASPPGAWRGGQHAYVLQNIVDGANHYGILSMARNAIFQGNQVNRTGLLENLGASGLGCRFGDGNCHSNGTAIFLTDDGGEGTNSRNVLARRNRVEGSGSVGITNNATAGLIEENVVVNACATKGDCAGIGAGTAVNLTVRRNIVRNVISPNDGFNSAYHDRYGFGIYVDVDASVECVDNTFTQTQFYGIMYTERSTGRIAGNTVYDVQGPPSVSAGGGSLVYTASQAQVKQMTGNVLVATRPMLVVFTESGGRILSSDANHYIQPYTSQYLSREEASWKLMSLPEWRSFSGQDAQSVDAWFSTAAGTPPVTELFVNETDADQTLTLGAAYLDLDQRATIGSITLAPFSSRVLVRN